MKKKIKADSVDELFEIVRAIQNGEEPEAYVKRKAAEEKAAQAAAEKALAEEKAAAKASEKALAEEKAAAKAEKKAAERTAREKKSSSEPKLSQAGKEEPDDAFERQLDEEWEDDSKDAAENLRGYLAQASAFVRETVLQTFFPKVKERIRQSWQRIARSDDPEEDQETPKQERLEEDQETPKQERLEKDQETPKRNLPGRREALAAQSHADSPEETPAPKRNNREARVRPAESDSLSEPIHSLGKIRLADTEKETKEGGKIRRRYGAKSISEEAETVGRRILHSLHMEPSQEKPSEDQPDAAGKQPAQSQPDETMDLDTLQILDRLLDHPDRRLSGENSADTTAAKGAGTAGEASEPAQSAATAMEEAGRAGEASEPAQSAATALEEAVSAGETSEPAQSATTAMEESVSAGETSGSAQSATTAMEKAVSAGETSEPAQSAATAMEETVSAGGSGSAEAETVSAETGITGASSDTTEAGGAPDLSGEASDKKDSRSLPERKGLMRRWGSALAKIGRQAGPKRIAAVGALAVVLAVLLVVFAAGHMMSIQKKRQYVTADKGLDILVENQPEEWCSSCELQLKVSVKSGTISSIEVGGSVCEPDESGIVTVTAEDDLLEAVVETDEGTLSATIEIPMLDAEAPVLTVDLSGGEIILTAEDGRSGVETIWYAVQEEDDWLQLPLYQEYSGPITFEEGNTYYFYAGDYAGNHSTPLVTNMQTAQAISLSETDLTLFPGETLTLSAEVTPSGALSGGLTYQSSNTDVVTVNESGLVTAVATGGALIKVSADGLETASCSVTVISEQTVTISAIGDCTLGTYAGSVASTNFDTYYSMYGASYFFENVRDILQNDDITFANLEGPLTDETTTPLDKTYAFKGDPSYTEILLDGSIEVVTLANNHSSDYGAQSLTDTKENLTEAGIEYCIGESIAYEEVSGIRIAFIGIYELPSGMECETLVRSTIAQAQSEGAALIVVAFHWGTEKETAADETQQALAHIAIDCGADLVVGHHPHVLQGIENYNGKYIVYSLGNFCFGGNSNPSDKDTMIFRQTFTITSEGVAEDDNIEIIPCTLSSESGYNDYRPTPASGSAADEIMERINEYSAAFGDITYTASTGL